MADKSMLETEHAKEVGKQREFYETSRPDRIKQYFRDGMYKVAIALSRTGIPQVNIISPMDVTSLDQTARLLSVVEITDPHFKNIDPSTDSGKLKIGILATAKAVATIEQNSHPVVKKEFTKFSEVVTSAVSDILSKTGVKKALLGFSGLALATTACTAQISPKTPEAGGTTQSQATEISTQGPPIGFEPSATPPATTESGPTLPAPTEPSTEIIRAPTLEEMVVLSEGGALPDFALTYYDAMKAEKGRIAQQLGVKAEDINIYYKDNGLKPELYRWALWVDVKDKGVAWPVNNQTKLLGDFPAYFQLDNPLNPEGPVHFDTAFGWALVGGSNARMIFAGTRPIIADVLGTATVNGTPKDVYSRYLLPGGIRQDASKAVASWPEMSGVTSTVSLKPTAETEPTHEPRLGFEIPVTWAEGVTFKIHSAYLDNMYISPATGIPHYSPDGMMYLIIESDARWVNDISNEEVTKLFGAPGSRNGKFYVKSSNYPKYKDFGVFGDSRTLTFIFVVRDSERNSEKDPLTLVNDLYNWSVYLSPLPTEKTESSGNKP